MSPAADNTAPTAKDALFFQTILFSMKNKPEVDWALVAKKTGYKDGKTASTRYGQIIKKMTGLTPGQAMAGAQAVSSSTATPVKATPAAAASTAINKAKGGKKGVGSGTNVNASKVTKRVNARKVKKTGVKVEVFEDEGDDEEEGEGDSSGEVILGAVDREGENDSGEEDFEVEDLEEEV